MMFVGPQSGKADNFTFNEAVSLQVTCRTQNEIDYYWEWLTDGWEAGVCGWLKDRFGVSWQVAPKVLGKMLRDPDTAKVERVTAAFLKMKKLDIDALKMAFNGETMRLGAVKWGLSADYPARVIRVE